MTSHRSRSSIERERQRRRMMQEAEEREQQNRLNEQQRTYEDDFWLYEGGEPAPGSSYETRRSDQRSERQKEERRKGQRTQSRSSDRRQQARTSNFREDRYREERTQMRRGEERRTARTAPRQRTASQRDTIRHTGKAHWHVDNPIRLATALIIFIAAIVLLITALVNISSRTDSAEQTAESASSSIWDTSQDTSQETSDVQDESSDETTESTQEDEEIEEDLTRSELTQSIPSETALDGVDDQLMAFMSGLMVNNISNYATEPEDEEEEEVETAVSYDYCIVIDPAHGGEDTGYVSDDLTESELTLTLALLVQEYLLTTDISCEVALTRSDDTYMEAEDRIAKANDAEADLFISLDYTSDENDTSASGMYALYWESDETAEISEAALSVAESLLSAAQETTGISSQGASTSVSEILYNADMPAVSLCLGYLTNETDRSILTDEETQEALAQSLAENIAVLVETYADVGSTEETEAADSADEMEDDVSSDDTTE